jgi:hypothetical protein
VGSRENLLSIVFQPAFPGVGRNIIHQVIKPMITQHRGFQRPQPEGFFQVISKKRLQRGIGLLGNGRVQETE